MGMAMLMLSDYLHANSSIAAHAPCLLVYLEHPNMWATRWSVDDGDGLTLVYEGADIHDGLLKEAVSLGWSCVDVETADGIATRTLTLHIRLTCIDAPEWFQAFLVAKPLLVYLLKELGWLVRISRAYYMDGTRRIFAEVTIGPFHMRSFQTVADAISSTYEGEQWDQQSFLPVRQEVPLHMFLLASGVVYLMPQYFFCCSVEDLYVTIDLYGLSRTSALESNRVLRDQRTAEQDVEDRQHLHHMATAWHTMVDTNAFQHFKLFFPLNRTKQAPQTVEQYRIALADWHKYGLNVHLSEPSSRPAQGGARVFLREDVCMCVHWGGPHGCLSEEALLANPEHAAKHYVWWRYDSDWGRFPEKMLWGKPHLAKKAWHTSTS